MTLKDAGKLSGLWIGVATNAANLNLKNAFKYWNEINDTQFNYTQLKIIVKIITCNS